MAEILTNWTAKESENFGKKPFLTDHNLHEREMFTDAGIASLLDRYPRDRVNLYTMNDDPSNAGRVFRRGDPGDLTGAELLEAINRGRLWLNLRAVNHELEDYEALCDDMFDELDSRVPGLKTFKRDCGFLISSPNAKVFYHLDIPCVTLWQIRGTKTMHVYPVGHPFATNEQLEAIIMRETEEELDYSSEFENNRETYVLTPGKVASWPQTAPHRIDNGDCVNISLSCEFQTFGSLVHANALYTNAVLRRKFGMSPDIMKDGAVSKYSKAALARALKLTRKKPKEYKMITPASFKVDLSEETGIRDFAAA